MRVTVLILGLLLGLAMLIQTFSVYVLGSVAKDVNTSQAAAVGVFMALLWLVGCAFVLPFPLLSVIAFIVAGVFGFAVSGNFPDLAIWGGVSLVLALFSFFGWLGKRKDRRQKRAERQAQAERDARYEALLTAQRPAQSAGVPCHACGAPNPPGTRFCGNCGANLAAGQTGTA